MVGNLVTDARRQDELAAVSKLCLQLTLQAKQDVAFLAPMIGCIAWRIFNHADTDLAQLLRPPIGSARISLMSRWLYLRPVGEFERDISNTHDFDSFGQVSADQRGIPDSGH